MAFLPPIATLRREATEAKTAVLRAVRLVFTHAPCLTIINIILVVLQGLLPLAALVVMKLIIDTVTAGSTSTDKALLVSPLLLLLGIAATIALLIALCQEITRYTTEVQSLVLTDVVTDQIQTHSIHLDLAYYENPTYHNNLHRAQLEGTSRPARIVTDLVHVGQSGISACAIGGVILTFSPLVGIILIGAALPATIVRIWHSRRLFDLRNRQTEAERKCGYYHLMLTDSYHAREIHQFGLGPLFRERYRYLQETLRSARLQISRSRAVWEILTQGLLTAAVFGSYAVIALMAFDGMISLGDLVMFFVGFQLCVAYIQSIFSNLNALYEDQLFLRNYFAFLDLKPQVGVPENPISVPSPFSGEIRFEDVSFTYPGAPSPALVGLNLSLHSGEIIALVGDNGAGKSTFIKLLCRLYAPGGGRITADGIDLEKTDPAEWQKQITVLFQDFVRYQLTVRENIWTGDAGQPADSSRVEWAAWRAGADHVIEKLPDGYMTLLGKLFSGGQDLSTGEWQKIAIARAFFRNAGIIILDEPASSLDSLAEAEIFHGFRELVRGRTAIIISHRFSTVLLADRIFVFSHGEIIEQGTHTELMAQNGHYAEMFQAQADPYRE